MAPVSHRDYFQRRALDQRKLASHAPNWAARIHREIADRYDELASQASDAPMQLVKE